MLKKLSLRLKLSLLPAVALLGLLLFVAYTSVQLAANDVRLDTLESYSFPTLECGFHADSDTHSTHIRTVIPR